MAFGQHQTFYLRQQWLTKGLLEANKDPRFFYRDDHFEILGVGKNMAKSIRYWLTATQLVKEDRSTQVEINLTKFGKILYEKDLYTKNPFSLGMIHYLLCTEKDIATAWYWFFNIFNERAFTKDLLNEQLNKWVKETIKNKVSASSIKKDIDCLLALYTVKEYNNQTPEDVIGSPFESLDLVNKTTNTSQAVYMKKPLRNDAISAILYASLVRYCEKYNIKEVGLNELVNSEELWGRVFNLNRDQIIEYLDEIKKKYSIIFTRTNNLDIIRLEDVNWIDVVKNLYETEVLGL